MRHNLQLALTLCAIGFLSFFFSCNQKEKEDTTGVEKLTEQQTVHKAFLANSPFKNTKTLRKKERNALGLPPDLYTQRIWELTMNPALGHPTPENLAVVQKQLMAQRELELANGRVPGDVSGNNWVERGPNNVGGRTRAVMFDPNDATNETVFAGGVSGGLWKNTKISDPASVWTSVDIPENLNISCITVDPNNTKIMYLGTGESYVSGDVNGNGVWKSTDGGNSWNHIFGGPEGESKLQTNASVVVNTPASISGEYLALGASFGPSVNVDITNDVVLVDDASTSPNQGCNALSNFLKVKGKIALIYRGNCTFVQKVTNAQNAGATAVIMINNEAGNPIVMGGDDPSGLIKIPSVMISMEAGAKLKAQLDAGNSVNTTIKAGANEFLGYYVLNGNQHVNDIVVRNNNGTSEVYIAAGATAYFDANPSTILGPDDYGLYKSVNGGNSWSAIGLPLTPAGNRYEPNDIEIAPDNTVWVATKQSVLYNDGGGTVFSAKDGTNFTKKHTLEGKRTQIAISKTDANKIYLLAEGSSVPVVMVKTTDGFTTTSKMTLPNDADTNIEADDFCRSQAFYNLVIAVDPTNDNTLYVGGIDAFKSSDAGATWTQLTHWYGGFGFPGMHADQHAIIFGKNDVSKMVYANDGGVYYSATSGTSPGARNNGYNVTQFYTVATATTIPVQGEYFVAGAQDNGNQYFNKANAGINASVDVTGGDGTSTFFDQDGTDTYFIANYVYNKTVVRYDYKTGQKVAIYEEDDNNGEFINIQALDSRLNYLFSNYSSGDTYAYRTYRTKLAAGETEYVVNTISHSLLSGSPTAMAVSPHEKTGAHTTLYLGLDNGKLLKVSNASAAGSQNWRDISSTAFLGSISDIEFGQTSNDIFVTFHNYGVNNIWYSNDGGNSWKQKDGDLPDIPVKAILQNPLNLEEVIVGTELGVWYTTNFSAASPTWKSAFNGMSNVKVMDLDLRDDNTVFAATYGRGVFSGKFTGESLSVADNVLKTGIGLSPTVSDGAFKVISKTDLGLVNLQIFNLSGQSVYVRDLNLTANNAQDIKIRGASGVYLAKFTNGSVSTVKKFIIK